MDFPSSPLSRFKIWSRLRKELKRDYSFKKGKIIGSMCSEPTNFAASVMKKYIGKNLGDPGLCPATAKIEKEAIEMLGSLLHNKNAAGVFTTGGTEANFLALWCAKKSAKPNQREVILSYCAHFSFIKAAEMMDLKLVFIPHKEDFTIDIEEVKKKISPQTMAIVAIAGTTGTGAIDNVVALGSLAEKHNLYLHVDAAFGGFVLPFLEENGFYAPIFDFQVPGVSSITIDPHKMGRGLIPGGCILFRSHELAQKASFSISYLAGGETKHLCLVGTRSGAAVLGNWAQMVRLGRKGYSRLIKNLMILTLFFYEELQKIPQITVIKKPEINVVAFSATDNNTEKLAFKLREHGWSISCFGNYLRVVLMPHVNRKILKNFLKDLKVIYGEDNG